MKKRNNILRGIATLMSLVLAIATIGQPGEIKAALVNENDTSSVKGVNVKNSNIPSSTLIIGSYLIHINGLTDEILERAEASANEFSQQNRYYKSELAGGKWFDVTEASSISDITTGGVAVDNSQVESLLFTHMVSENGTVTDLRYGYKVSPFDIEVPYCLWDLEELEAIEIQYQILEKKTGKTDSDEVAMAILEQFYGKTIRTNNTDRYDNIISGLEKYKNDLAERGKPSVWAEEVHKVMVHTDALRRVEAYTLLSGNLEKLLDDISGLSDATAETEDYIINGELVDAIGTASEAVEKSILEYSAQILSDNDSAMIKMRLQYSNELMNAVSVTSATSEYSNLPWYFEWYEIWLRVRANANVSYNQGRCDDATQKLVNMTSVSGGTIIDLEAESKTLELLAEQAYSLYKEKLRAGISDEYREAVLQNATQSVKEKCLTDQKTETNSARLEYQSILSGYFQRLGNDELQKYIEELIEEIPDLLAVIPEDAVQKYQAETVEEHRDWLCKELTNAIKEGTDTSEMDELKEELEELELQRQSALDHNDLAEEKRIAAEIEGKQEEIRALEEKYKNILTSPNSTEREKAGALAGLGESNAVSMLNAMAEEIASGIRSGESSESIKNKMQAFEALSILEPETALSALSKIESAMDNASVQDESLQEYVESALESMENALEDKKQTSSQDGMATGKNPETDELQRYITEILGNSMDEATVEMQTAAVLALSKYGENFNNGNARKLAISYGTDMYENGNPYVYLQYKESLEKYVSLKAVGDVLGYRYIFEDFHHKVTLNKGSSYYSFTKGSTEYAYTGYKVGDLGKKAECFETIYIETEDAKTIFNVQAGYVAGCDYAIVVTPEVEEFSNEIYQQLTEKG